MLPSYIHDMAMQVCAVEGDWVSEITDRLHEVDVERLSGGPSSAAPMAHTNAVAAPSVGVATTTAAGQARVNQAAVEAAKARFAARKAARLK